MIKSIGLFTGAGLVLSVLIGTSVVWADEFDAASANALMQTQRMLQDPALRQKAVDETPAGQQADGQLKALAGNQKATDDLYMISGSVMEDLVKETGGDPAKMMQIVNQAQSDPQSLERHLSDQNKTAIHHVSTEIDNDQGVRAPASEPQNAKGQ